MVGTVLASGALAAGCPSGGVRVVGPGVGGGGLGGGGGGGSASLVGTWRNLTTLVGSGGETIVLDTRWTFAPGGACTRTGIRTVVSGSQGREFTEIRNCTYSFTGRSVSVVFEGSTFIETHSVSFSGGLLLLDGFPFTRIG